VLDCGGSWFVTFRRLAAGSFIAAAFAW
jgi:hypothetical protein